MQPRPAEHDRPVIDVRILDDTGRWQQRSAVFADAGTIEALVWAVEAVGQALVGEAALAGVRGIALSRQRGGKPSPRLAAHAVARRFIEEKFGDVVQDLPFEEEMKGDFWILHFESESGRRRYVIKTKNVRKLGGKRRPQVTEAKRTDVRRDDQEDH